MKIIADSGSTKTDWVLIKDNKKTTQLTTQGLNPVHKSEEEIQAIIKSELLPELSPHEVQEIHFYGAGCMAFEKAEEIQKALETHFTHSNITVETDMLAAARATAGNQAGIIAILGTGANICRYNGQKIEERRSGWGYILGDEGSGAHLGISFIKAYLNQELPDGINQNFIEKFNLTPTDIIQRVYREKNANVFLASFAEYMLQNKQNKFVAQLIKKCFIEFFEKQVIQFTNYQNYPLHLVGSIAHHFSEFIQEAANEYQIEVSTIVEKPINMLVSYHQA